MNINEAKTTLLLFRPGSADAADPHIAEALRLAERDDELARWLAEHCARQAALRGKFQQIAAPAGLMEQIISEQAAFQRRNYWRPRLTLVTAAVAIVLALWMAGIWFPRHPADDTLANYQSEMARVALKGYYLDLTTNDPAPIRAFLSQQLAPADYVLPAGLAKATFAGCTTIGWQEAKVSMICLRTGRPQAPGQGPDLWLFVVDRTAIPDAPAPGPPCIGLVNHLTTAVWTQGNQVYLLGLQGDESTIRKFL